MSFIKDTFFGGAEKKAAQARAAGISEGVEEDRRQFDLVRGDFDPTIASANEARDREAAFLGLRGREAEQGAIDSFIESPGQAFLRERAERSLLRNSAAIGGLGGGNVRRDLNEQAIGIAAGQMGQHQDRLANVAMRGDNAIANRAGISTGISNNIASGLAGRGEAIGSGIEARASGIRGGLARVAGAFTGTGGFSNPFAKPPVNAVSPSHRFGT